MRPVVVSHSRVQRAFPASSEIRIHRDILLEISYGPFSQAVGSRVVRGCGSELYSTLPSPLFESPTSERRPVIRDNDLRVLEHVSAHHVDDAIRTLPPGPGRYHTRTLVDGH